MLKPCVYLVKPLDENEELRYSLRSLRNLPHSEVWIVGYKPNWVTNVNYLPVQALGHKYTNGLLNTRAILECPDIADDFILFNDDFFVTRFYDAPLPMFHQGSLAERILTRQVQVGNSQYNRSMLDTWRILKMWRIENPVSYSVHYPMPINKWNMKYVLDRVDKDWADYGKKRIAHLHRRTLYGNYSQGDSYGPVSDCKIVDYSDDGKSTYRRGAFISTDDLPFQKGLVGSYIRGLFPDPSPYEGDVFYG